MATKAPRKGGVWLPWKVVQQLATLRLRPQSCWPALFTILAQQYGFGGKVAFMKLAELAELTRMSLPTTKRAVAVLIKTGLVHRDKRYGRLTVKLTDYSESLTKLRHPKSASPRNTKLTPRKDQQVDTSSICIPSLLSRGSGFTTKQMQTIKGVLKEASLLLDSDAALLTLTAASSSKLSLPIDATYREMLDAVSMGEVLARDAVAAVIALKNDKRVQGEELELTPCPEKAT